MASVMVTALNPPKVVYIITTAENIINPRVYEYPVTLSNNLAPPTN